MTIIRRSDLNRPLTFAELDGNFDQVETLVAQANLAVSTAQNEAASASTSAAASQSAASQSAASQSAASQSAASAQQYSQDASDAAAQAGSAAQDKVDNFAAELAADDGYTRIPSVQIQRWRDVGDIRGWGAKCDGVTDDIVAINQAIAARSGNILVPATTKVSTHVVFEDYSNFTCKWSNRFVIDTSFVFSGGMRGIIRFTRCSDFTIDGYAFTGAKLDNPAAPEPWQDGDAGIEFYQCTGQISILNAKGSDVKTWGAIAVDCGNAHFYYLRPYFKNCQVQSGIGGIGVGSLVIVEPRMEDIGLYGIENEARDDPNYRLHVVGGISVLCNKGIAVVHNSNNVLVESHEAYNCKVGYSFTGENTTDTTRFGRNHSLKNCVATSCKSSFQFLYSQGGGAFNCEERRDNLEYYVRTRALDRIVKITGGKSYVALDSPTENPNITVNMVIQLDDGSQYTVSAVDSAVTTDPVFGNMIGFTTTTAIPSSMVRSSFRRYVQVSTGKTSLELYGGTNLSFIGNKFAWSETIVATYDDHNYLQWEGNTSYSCTTYFAQGSAGAVTGNMRIESGENQNFGDFGAISKFASILSATRTYAFKGGTTNAQTTIVNAAPIDAGYVGSVSCAINSGQTTTGTIVFKIAAINAIVGSFSGSPLRATATLNPALAVSGATTFQLVDTVGDLIASGYAVTVKGAFR